MYNKRNLLFLVVFLATVLNSFSQEKEVFTLTEFLAMVKKYHPVAAQADLKLSEAEAKLLKARGVFDPKLKGGLNEKNYSEKPYYSLWKGSFTIPTWYGIDLDAKYVQNEGQYLNPQNKVPEEGLWSVGLSIDLARGLLYNQRMNTVRQAKILREKSKLEKEIALNSLLADAAQAYIQWDFYYHNREVHRKFLKNAKIRFKGISRASSLGANRAIDTVESKVTVLKRELEWKEATLKLQKAQLALSNYLWVDGVPVELESRFLPQLSQSMLSKALHVDRYFGNAKQLVDHPEIRSLAYDVTAYELATKLGKNKLLPKVKAHYNFLTTEQDYNYSLSTQHYKVGVTVEIPIFLRKERGALKMAKAKQKNATYKLAQKEWQLANKIKALEREIGSLTEQLQLMGAVVKNNEVMVNAEKRLFAMGESSIFYVNTRENKLMDTQLKKNKMQKEFYRAVTELFQKLRLKIL